jgi:hypothetical protein
MWRPLGLRAVSSPARRRDSLTTRQDSSQCDMRRPPCHLEARMQLILSHHETWQLAGSAGPLLALSIAPRATCPVWVQHIVDL